MRIFVLICMTLVYTSVNAAYICRTDVLSSTPDSDFIDNGDETVTHISTGLTWKTCVEGLSGAACKVGTAATTHTWQQALQIPENLNSAGGFAGQSDWRLPNMRELESIVEVSCADPYINMKLFPATSSGAYWSSTPYVGEANYSSGTGRSWAVYFDNGATGPLVRTSYYLVRLVRGGTI